MTSPRSNETSSAGRHAFVPVGPHELHVMEWGDPANPPLVMWHGLSRTGRDFDELAAAFAADRFVLCPDTIGRGLSTWTEDMADHSASRHAELALGMLDAYGIAKTGWIGTSMGGIIGMRIASGERADMLSWLVINDIGPEVPQAAIDRIKAYAGITPVFRTVSEIETTMRERYLAWGPASDAFWQRMAISSARRLPDGTFTTHHDPRLIAFLTTNGAELTTWDRWERIACPVHLLGGRQSDILLPEIAERMERSGPKPAVTWWDDCGHAPTLSRPADLDTVRRIVTELEARNPT